MPGRSKIVLRGNNMLKPPLFETEDAHIIEFYDSFGDLNALFCRILSDDCWGLVTKSDGDWQATLVRYGYLDVKKPIIDVLRYGL